MARAARPPPSARRCASPAKRASLRPTGGKPPAQTHPPNYTKYPFLYLFWASEMIQNVYFVRGPKKRRGARARPAEARAHTERFYCFLWAPLIWGGNGSARGAPPRCPGGGAAAKGAPAAGGDRKRGPALNAARQGRARRRRVPARGVPIYLIMGTVFRQ